VLGDSGGGSVVVGERQEDGAIRGKREGAGQREGRRRIKKSCARWVSNPVCCGLRGGGAVECVGAGMIRQFWSVDSR